MELVSSVFPRRFSLKYYLYKKRQFNGESGTTYDRSKEMGEKKRTSEEKDEFLIRAFQSTLKNALLLLVQISR